MWFALRMNKDDNIHKNEDRKPDKWTLTASESKFQNLSTILIYKTIPNYIYLFLKHNYKKFMYNKILLSFKLEIRLFKMDDFLVMIIELLCFLHHTQL